MPIYTNTGQVLPLPYGQGTIYAILNSRTASPAAVELDSGGGRGIALYLYTPGPVATATVSAGGAVTAVNLVWGGHNVVTPSVTIAAPQSGVQATVTGVVSNGQYTGFTNLVGGSGYSQANPPAVTFGALDGTDTLQVVIENQDTLSQQWIAIFQPTALAPAASATPVRYRVFPAATGSATVVANDELGSHFRVRVVHGGTTGFTYSLGYTILP